MRTKAGTHTKTFADRKINDSCLESTKEKTRRQISLSSLQGSGIIARPNDARRRYRGSSGEDCHRTENSDRLRLGVSARSFASLGAALDTAAAGTVSESRGTFVNFRSQCSSLIMVR